MSVLETVRTKVKELSDGPAGDLFNSAKSSIAHGLDGAGRFVDEKTNGKYSSKIHTGVDKAKVLLGEGEESEQASPPSEQAPGGQSSGKQSSTSGKQSGGEGQAGPDSASGDDRPES